MGVGGDWSIPSGMALTVTPRVGLLTICFDLINSALELLLTKRLAVKLIYLCIQYLHIISYFPHPVPPPPSTQGYRISTKPAQCPCGSIPPWRGGIQCPDVVLSDYQNVNQLWRSQVMVDRHYSPFTDIACDIGASAALPSGCRTPPECLAGVADQTQASILTRHVGGGGSVRWPKVSNLTSNFKND